MATWVIGDVHGCWRTLEKLLKRIDWRPGRDDVWMVGDLVNRGPSSLEVLRWAWANRDCIEVVLGNHDLHLLSRAAGVRAAKKGDTLDEILEAPDREELLGWLRNRPLIHHFGPFVMVHAGLLPEWNIERTCALADTAADHLRGADYGEFLKAVSGARTDRDGDDQIAGATAAMTRVRMVDADGRPQLGFNGSPGDAPQGWHPWFDFSAVRRQGYALIFGHWAMLGYHRDHDVACLDSGCVYGGKLTALRLRDGRVVREPVADAIPHSKE
jgi:bis(5'-nucleosyl)-tetraphosphatase (symmetrical)